MAACAYRSLEPVLQERLAVLQERRAKDTSQVEAARRVAMRRMGRAWGGAVALGIAVLAFVAGLLALPATYDTDKWLRELATVLLFAAPVVGLVVLVCGRLFGRAWLTWTLDVPLRLTGDAATDLSRLESTDPLQESREVAMRWERASIALPLAAVSMLAPLTIHGVVWGMLSWPSGNMTVSSLSDYGEWIALSALIVGHAHLAVLIGTVRWAFRLRETPTVRLGVDLHKHWGLTLLVAMGVACVPGIVLLGIPPLMVGITGIAFLPATYGLAARAVVSERFELDAV
jgi:hypothetical protein